MIVWGGHRYESTPYYYSYLDFVQTGGSYDPESDTWATLPTQDAPTGRTRHTAVWTGTEMIVWGGYGVPDRVNDPFGEIPSEPEVLPDGGRYDPVAGTWGPLKGDDKIRTRIVGNIIEHYRRLHPEQTHTLAFAPGVKESLWAAHFCRGRGIRSLHIDGQDFWCDGVMRDRKADDQIFQGYMQEWREGKIPIIWNRFVLREGIDEPLIRHL